MPITPVRIPYLRAMDFVQSGDNGDYALAANRAIAALRGSRGEVVLPNQAEAYRTQMTLASNVTVRGAGSATEIIQDAPGNASFYVAGSIGAKANLTANALAGATTITLPTGGGAVFGAGDSLVLESTTIVYGTTGRTRDMRRVLGVAGDVLTLDGALLHDFLTSATAQYAKVTPKTGVAVRDFAVSNTNPGTNTGFAVRAQVAADVRIADLTIRDAGGGILLFDVLGGHVSDCTIDRLRNGSTLNPTMTDKGYGITLAGATALATITGCSFRGTRHAVTTLADERAGTPSTFWGGPRDCVIANCVSNQAPDGFAHFDSHEFGTNLTYANCIADGGGAEGFLVRASGVMLIGCKAYRCGHRGVYVTATAKDTVIDGGEFAYSAEEGIGLNGVNATVRGAWIHHGAKQGISVGADATDPVVMGCRINDNGQTTSGYGIQDGFGATNPIIKANIIPWSSTQDIGILNLGATGVAVDNDLPGHTGDRGVRTANASAYVKRNRGFATEGFGAASIANGGNVSHGLQRTPTIVTVTSSVAKHIASVTAISATTFTVALYDDTGTAVALAETVYWRAEA